MKIKISLGFEVDVDECGRFELPERKFNTTELKKIAREVNREIRDSQIDLSEVMSDDE